MAASTRFVFAFCFFVLALGSVSGSTIPPLPQEGEQLLQEPQEPLDPELQAELQEALGNVSPQGGFGVVGVPAEPAEPAENGVITTQAPPTTTRESSTTVAPTSSAPTTTSAPSSSAPTTSDSSTSAPTTSDSSTSAPTTTSEPSTSAPTTSAPSTSAPTTSESGTAAPTNSDSRTVAPTTSDSSTSAPTTSVPTTSEPSTVAPTSSAPTTVAPTTQAESTTTTAAPALVPADTNTAIVADTTTTTTGPVAPVNPTAVPFPLPPYNCYDCNSGSALPGYWRNKNCDSTGYVADWYIPRPCNTYCFSSVGLYPAGAVFRGCASSLYLKGRPLQQGCFDDAANNRHVCLCAGDNCNTHDLSDLAEVYVDRHFAMKSTTAKVNAL